MPDVNYAFPKTLGRHNAKCDYCAAVSTKAYKADARLHGIYTCGSHVAWATRDICAYLQDLNVVPVEAFLGRFPLLSDSFSIKVPRSDGSITEGAKFSLSSLDEFRFVRKNHCGDWVVTVAWSVSGEPFLKDIKVTDLALSGIDAEPIIAVLQTGFYKEQHDARNLAMAAADD
jgi:hypothetical protein